MPSPRDLPAVTPDLRIAAARDVSLTPAEALRFAETLTTAAMMRQAALMPARRRRRLFSDNLTLSTARMITR